MMRTQWHRKLAAAAVGFFMGGLLCAVAQPEPPEPPRPPNPERPGRPPRDFQGGGDQRRLGPGQAMAPGLMRVLGVLTPEQRESIRDIMQDNREQAREAEQKLAKAREALLEESLKAEFDAKAVRKLARQVAELEAERTVSMAEALSKVDPPLSESQKKEIREPRPMGEGQGRFREQWRDPNRRPGPPNAGPGSEGGPPPEQPRQP